MSENKKTEVLIVGAGPVGLMLANLLAKQNVAVRIIDKDLPRRAAASRAEGVHVRSLELFERIGVLEFALAEGRELHHASLYANGEKLARVSFDDQSATFQGALILEQSKIERILADQLTDSTIAVERPKELVSFRQNESGVAAVVKGERDAKEIIEAEYMIACDGGKSLIRHQLNAEFDGNAIPGHFGLADVSIDWADAPLNDDVHIFMSPLAIVGRLAGGTWKIAASMPADFPAHPAPAEIVGFLEKQLQTHNLALRLRDAQWTSDFRLSSRMVTKFRFNRVILAGDAAHIHSPMGGQGMNEGFQDALNLSWKLALVLQHYAAESLLDTYQTERAPLIKKVLEDTERMTKIIESKNTLITESRNQLIKFIAGFDFAHPFLREEFTGSKRNISRSPTVAESKMSFGGHLQLLGKGERHPNPLDEIEFARAPQAGMRAPDADGIIAENGASQRWFEIRRDDWRHQLLIFTGAKAEVSAERISELQQTISETKSTYGKYIRPLLVTTRQQADNRDVLEDSQGKMSHRYGARAECLYLIRPDGFIGFRSQPVNLAAFAKFWEQMLR